MRYDPQLHTFKYSYRSTVIAKLQIVANSGHFAQQYNSYQQKLTSESLSMKIQIQNATHSLCKTLVLRNLKCNSHSAADRPTRFRH